MDDLWAAVYARKSISKMFGGKSYTKTLWTSFLTNADLRILLLRPKAGAEAEDEDDDEDGSEETGRDQQEEQLAGESNGDIPDDPDHAGSGDGGEWW